MRHVAFFLRQMIHGVLFFMCSSPLPFVSCGLKIAIVHWVLPVAVFAGFLEGQW